MSNAVDIVMVDGPAHGRMVCMERDKMTTYVEFPVLGANGGLANYTVVKREIAGQWYRFGVPTGMEPQPDDSSVLLAGAQPAWDLNRAQVTP